MPPAARSQAILLPETSYLVPPRDSEQESGLLSYCNKSVGMRSASLNLLGLVSS